MAFLRTRYLVNLGTYGYMYRPFGSRALGATDPYCVLLLLLPVRAAAAALTLVWPQPIWIIWLVEWIYFSGIGLGSWLYLRKLDWNQLSHEINAQ